MGVGIPASGKTTMLCKLAVDLDIKRICTDDIREEFFGYAADQSHNQEAWLETYQRVAQELAAGRPVIIDATHTERFRRIEAIERYRSWGAAAVVATVLSTPIEICIKRNMNRSRQVPNHVIYKMYSKLKAYPPALSEGFDKIIGISSEL